MSHEDDSLMTTIAQKIEMSSSYAIVKRDGRLVPFQRERIANALEAAFRDTKQVPKPKELLDVMAQTIERLTDLIEEEVVSTLKTGKRLTVEDIQDVVEKLLMENGHHDVVRDYIIYRETHKKLREDSPRHLKILRSDGLTFVRFNPIKIVSALEKAFCSHFQINGPTPFEIINQVDHLTRLVVKAMKEEASCGNTLTVEIIQDEIERQLMKEGHYAVAKEYILHRANPQLTKLTDNEDSDEVIGTVDHAQLTTVTRVDGSSYKISQALVEKKIHHAIKGHDHLVNAQELIDETLSNFYEGIKENEIDLAMILAARTKIEKEPEYSYVAANLLLDTLYRESMGVEAHHPNLKNLHKKYFSDYFKHGVSIGRIDPALLSFNLEKLADAIDLDRDHLFTYLGLQTLHDRYFIHEEGRRLETPQIFWMRVAMGVSLNEGKQKEARAIEFYNVLSRFYYISGTPTLFNSGTPHSQLSSCYLSTVMDDLHHIYKVIADDAQLSKWAGGLGNDWTNVRATGSLIKGTNGKSQGVIPFLKVANDTAVAVNQGGKRKGAMCAYLETWHLDIEDFLELRKNTGDERRRTHDMNTANWIPDLFIKRVLENGKWTLFSPNEVPDLHHIYGEAFEQRYIAYEKMALQGELRQYKQVEATALWRKMLGMVFETGHPWITFKDPSNIRSPQDHAGVVHSSNLCTEILLNTSVDETAVCNLGSINLAAHTTAEGLNQAMVAQTIKTAIRMLDNVIDINFYPTAEAKAANSRHRPIGLGLMGFLDALYIQNISYASHEAVAFSDKSMEMISYYAILASSELAKERGTYSSYKGSKWHRGLLPIDTIQLLAEQRGEAYLEMDTTCSLDWDVVRASVAKYGMRNSNTMAIAPTATIANIAGVTQSIEPMYKHLFVKSNLSGEFTVLNPYLVNKLKEMDMWNEDVLDDLKYFDGSLNEIDSIPDSIKALFPTAFEIDPSWIIECASRRQKWIDMGQSLNLYLAEPNGKKLHDMYLSAWKKGLKTTYYLRTMGATHIEKSTTDINKRDLQPRWMKNKSATSRVKVERGQSCSLSEGCESCQ
jgi:ribonucleoside-diphosphate reductase alpha chain